MERLPKFRRQLARLWPGGRRADRKTQKFGHTAGQKRILVSWYIDPRYIAPPLLSDCQVTVGPNVRANQPLAPFDAFTPVGRFDLYAALESARLPTAYDLIIVWSDGSGTNQPINLEAFDCPKVFCVGDTHHMIGPIRRMIDYAGVAKFDFIVSMYNRQHLHWFIESGFDNIAWIPGLLPNISRSLSSDRRPELFFFGSAGKLHPRRARLLAELKNCNQFSCTVRNGTAESGADGHARSIASLNCSLNGDLNLRIFEVLAAGGCLLTDRLSPQAGLDLLLTEGLHYAGYDSVEECIDQAGFLLAHPDIAFAIARSGHEIFHAHMRPGRRQQQLFDWVFRGQIDSLFRVTEFPRPGNSDSVDVKQRIHLYEQLQDLHRVQESLSVLFWSDVPDIQVLDALDLRRLRIAISASEEYHRVAKPPEILERCRVMPIREVSTMSWDCVITRDGTLPSAFGTVSVR